MDVESLFWILVGILMAIVVRPLLKCLAGKVDQLKEVQLRFDAKCKKCQGNLAEPPRREQLKH